jgi:hypothetical protein
VARESELLPALEPVGEENPSATNERASSRALLRSASADWPLSSRATSEPRSGRVKPVRFVDDAHAAVTDLAQDAEIVEAFEWRRLEVVRLVRRRAAISVRVGHAVRFEGFIPHAMGNNSPPPPRA